MHDASAPEAGNTAVADQPKYAVDHNGQLEIEGLDTPIGEAAEKFLQADAQFKTATEARNSAMTDLINQMRDVGIRTLKFKGDTLQYQPGHTTPDKIKFIPTTQ